MNDELMITKKSFFKLEMSEYELRTMVLALKYFVDEASDIIENHKNDVKNMIEKINNSLEGE